MRRLEHLDSIDQAHAYRLQRASRLLRRALVRQLADWEIDVSPEQYVVLWRLHERDGRMSGELVDPWLDDRPNLTRVVDGLQRRGHVERRRDPEDRRRSRVWLTPAGRQLMEDLLPRVVETRHALFGGLSNEDLAALERVMKHLETTLGG